MKFRILSFCLAVGFTMGSHAWAQDTTHVRLGRVSLDKQLTQKITIQGQDLFKIPFTNLNQAISVWFNLGLTNEQNFVFIVDGNPLMDVNAISIYDIEQISLVSYAATVYNTGYPQQVVYISTRLKTEKKHAFEVAAQGYIVANQHYNPSTDKNESTKKGIYHQYYVSYRNSIKKLNYGISANYLHDVLPLRKPEQLQIRTPYHLDRTRINAYADLQIDQSTSLSLTANYAPQQMNASTEWRDTTFFSSPVSSILNFTHQTNLFNTSLQINTEKKGWYNHFLAAYNSYDLKIRAYQNTLFTNTPNVTNNDDTSNKGRSIWLSEEFGYNVRSGHWVITPGVNISYRHINDEQEFTRVFSQGISITTSTYGEQGKGPFWGLVPSVVLRYKNAAMVQGGFLALLQDFDRYHARRNRPFLSASANIVQLIDEKAHWNGTLYASYADANNFEKPYYFLAGMSEPLVGTRSANTTQVLYNRELLYLKQTKQQQFGSTLDLPNQQLQVDYNFQKLDYQNEVFVILPAVINFGYIVERSDVKMKVHRIALRINTSAKHLIKWHSQLQSNIYSSRFNLRSLVDAKQTSGLTIGWANRIAFKKVSLAADLVYWQNEQWTYLGNTSSVTSGKSFSLQNLSFAYRLRQNAEIYFGMRNAFDNKKSMMEDRRRYFGGGLHINF